MGMMRMGYGMANTLVVVERRAKVSGGGHWLEGITKGHDGLAKRTKEELETKQDAATDSEHPQPKFTVSFPESNLSKFAATPIHRAARNRECTAVSEDSEAKYMANNMSREDLLEDDYIPS